MANGNGFRSRPAGGDAGGGRGQGGTRPPQRSGFVYKERSVDSLKALAERTSGRYDSIYKAGVSTWKPKQGYNVIRFLPPSWDDAEHYALTVWVHGYIGPDQGSYLCLAKMLRKPCPLCKVAHDAKLAGDEEESRSLGAQERMLAWILDRDGEDPTKPVMWNMSWSQARDIASLCHNRRTNAPLWIDQPDVGYDVTFQRTGTTMKNTKYFGYQIERDASPISKDVRVMDQILRFVEDNPLPEVLQYYPADYLAKALLGTTHAVEDTDTAKELLTAPRTPRESYEEGVEYAETEEEAETEDTTPWEGEEEDLGTLPPEPAPAPEPRPSRRFSDRVPPEERQTGTTRQVMRPRPPTR